VVATLWQISGLTATDVVERVYDQIVFQRNGIIEIDTDRASAALRTAIRAIRNESPDLPAVYWAAHIHSGP
jgi:hypothetical protein